MALPIAITSYLGSFMGPSGDWRGAGQDGLPDAALTWPAARAIASVDDGCRLFIGARARPACRPASDPDPAQVARGLDPAVRGSRLGRVVRARRAARLAGARGRRFRRRRNGARAGFAAAGAAWAMAGVA